MIQWIVKKVQQLNAWQKKIKFNQAIKKATSFAAESGKKIWMVKIDGHYVTMSKNEFKELWKRNPAMKFRTIQQWRNHVHEFNGNSR